MKSSLYKTSLCRYYENGRPAADWQRKSAPWETSVTSPTVLMTYERSPTYDSLMAASPRNPQEDQDEEGEKDGRSPENKLQNNRLQVLGKRRVQVRRQLHIRPRRRGDADDRRLAVTQMENADKLNGGKNVGLADAADSDDGIRAGQDHRHNDAYQCEAAADDRRQPAFLLPQVDLARQETGQSRGSSATA